VSHSADYLKQRAELLDSRSVTVVGGGQSGAEIFLDLLLNGRHEDSALTWITLAGHFFPTEEAGFALELSTPAYSTWFQGLPATDREALLAAQTVLHKGARRETLEEIFDVLYARHATDDDRTELRTDATLQSIARDGSGAISMTFVHGQSGRRFERVAEKLVLATGYVNRIPTAIDGISDRIRYDDNGRIAVAANYSIDRDGDEIFMHNNDFHSHGISVFDLGMVCHRNTVIINALAERPVYTCEPATTFQQFGPPESETGAHPDPARPAP
jgi:lysine N6-hydroxylase